jgi:hypothetical protein
MSRQEGQLLLQSAGDLVAKLVQERGGFVPFAVALTSEGLRIVAVEFAEDGSPAIDQLREAIRGRVEGGQYYAVAVAAETEVIDPQTGRQTRAARVEVEHRALPPVTWFWPFEQSAAGWQFGGGSGEGYLEEGEGRFFGGHG